MLEFSSEAPTPTALWEELCSESELSGDSKSAMQLKVLIHMILTLTTNFIQSKQVVNDYLSGNTSKASLIGAIQTGIENKYNIKLTIGSTTTLAYASFSTTTIPRECYLGLLNMINQLVVDKMDLEKLMKAYHIQDKEIKKAIAGLYTDPKPTSKLTLESVQFRIDYILDTKFRDFFEPYDSENEVEYEITSVSEIRTILQSLLMLDITREKPTTGKVITPHFKLVKDEL